MKIAIGLATCVVFVGSAVLGYQSEHVLVRMGWSALGLAALYIYVVLDARTKGERG